MARSLSLGSKRHIADSSPMSRMRRSPPGRSRLTCWLSLAMRERIPLLVARAVGTPMATAPPGRGGASAEAAWHMAHGTAGVGPLCAAGTRLRSPPARGPCASPGALCQPGGRGQRPVPAQPKAALPPLPPRGRGRPQPLAPAPAQGSGWALAQQARGAWAGTPPGPGDLVSCRLPWALRVRLWHVGKCCPA